MSPTGTADLSPGRQSWLIERTTIPQNPCPSHQDFSPTCKSRTLTSRPVRRRRGLPVCHGQPKPGSASFWAGRPSTLPAQSATLLKTKALFSVFQAGRRLFLLFFTANSSDVHRQLRTSQEQNGSSRGIIFPVAGRPPRVSFVQDFPALIVVCTAIKQQREAK